MKYTDDDNHYPILGKAGDFVDVLSRVPADTEIILKVDNAFSDWREYQKSVFVKLANYNPIEHSISLMDDGSLKNTLELSVVLGWNRDENLPEAFTFAAMFRVLDSLFDYGYDFRKIPKSNNLAKTAANNPHAFLDMLNEFHKKYKNKNEKTTKINK